MLQTNRLGCGGRGAAQLNNLRVSSNSNLCGVDAKPSPRRRDTEPGASNLITVRAPHIPAESETARVSRICPPLRPKDCIWLLRRCATTTKAVSLPPPAAAPPPPSTPTPPASDCNLLRDENRKARKIEGTPVFHYQAVGDV